MKAMIVRSPIRREPLARKTLRLGILESRYNKEPPVGKS
jgi:hypothetical protein